MNNFKIIGYKKDGSTTEVYPQAADMNARLTMMEQSDLFTRLEVFVHFMDEWLFMFKTEAIKK